MTGVLYFICFFFAGEFLANLFSLPIPGSIVGLFLAIVFIFTFPRMLPALRDGSEMLLRFLPLFLAPVVVGVFYTFVDMKPSIYVFALITVVALSIGVVSTSLIMKIVMSWQDRGTKAAE
ncbi:MAG: CidA/LrgA family protein [Afipia sp.]|nr:CidA/LrgA family protein [Afipia sp.]